MNMTKYILLIAISWLSVYAQLPTVPSEHPRLYLTADDVAELGDKTSMPEFAAKWDSIRNYFSNQHPVAAAIVYLIEGNAVKGRWAINKCLADIQGSNAYSRWYAPIHYSAIVYDWCYPLLTEQEKQIFISNFKRILAESRSGYPASINTNPVSAGTTEGEVLTGHLPAGIAIYNEDQQMYNAAAQLFFEKFVPVRAIVFASHSYHQGDSYINRVVYDMFGAWMFKRMSGLDVYTADAQYVPYSIIYNRRPDGRQIRRGDTFDLTGNYGDKRLLFMLTGTYYSDPYMLKLADEWDAWFDGFQETLHFIFREPAVEKRSFNELGLTKFYDYPMGEMTARTGWDISSQSDDTIMFMRIGGIYFHSHNHRDMGTFQIYHKGPLATTSGIYQSSDTHSGTEHWKNYYQQTLSHNGLLIFDPDEEMVAEAYRSVNDGGQRMPNNGYYPTINNLNNYVLAKNLRHSFGSDAKNPEYSYISGDINNAYTNKVSVVKRSMVSFNFGDAIYPAAMIVFDRVVSTNPNFKKTWLLHSHYEPQIDGNEYVVTNNAGDYSGKLVGQSLLPETVNITKIGGEGKEFWVESVQTNFAVTPLEDDEPAAWRVEISPTQPSNQDFFLNVLTVMDSSITSQPAATTVEDLDGLAIGAATQDRMVLFAKGSSLLEVISFNLPGNSPVKVLLTDLAAGTWKISQNQTQGEYHQVEAAGGTLYATLDPALGTVTAHRVPNLISHYEFDGNLLNSVDGAGEGLSRNGAASTCTKPQEYGLDTNGCFADLTANKWIHIGYPHELGMIATSQQMTLSMWVKTANSAYSQLLGRRYEWRLYLNGGKPVFSATSSAGAITLAANQSIADGEWNHITATYDGSTGEAILYINGQQNASLQQSSPLVEIVSTLRAAIAGMADSWSEASAIYDGFVDDVRVYNEVLSPTQVQYLYQSTQQKFCQSRPQMDLTGDCEVCLGDWAIFSSGWLVTFFNTDLTNFVDNWLRCGLLNQIDCR